VAVLSDTLYSGIALSSISNSSKADISYIATNKFIFQKQKMKSKNVATKKRSNYELGQVTLNKVETWPLMLP
jgi:hypothetical protein